MRVNTSDVFEGQQGFEKAKSFLNNVDTKEAKILVANNKVIEEHGGQIYLKLCKT